MQKRKATKKFEFVAMSRCFIQHCIEFERSS